MNLFEILKQFKTLEPDPAYKENSKRAVLAVAPSAAALHGWTAQRTIWKIVETAAAVALTGFFVLLLTGAFSGSTLSPVPYAAIDPQSLRAEAQAIDMQIQLANLNYTESAAESTMQAAGAKPGAGRTVPSLASPAPAVTGAAPGANATGTTSTVTIDQALQGLAQ